MEIENKQSGRISFVFDKSVAVNPIFVANGNQIIGGFEWEIRELQTYHEEGKIKLEFLIHCKNFNDKLWLAHVGIITRIIGVTNRWGDRYKLNEHCTHFFFNGNQNLKIEHCFSYDANDRNDPSVDIDIKVLRDLPSMMELDTNLEIIWNQLQENGETKQKNEVIAVNKSMLATNSNYFRSLFSGNWAESFKQQFTINEEFDDCLAFKRMIYATMMGGWLMLMDKEQIEEIIFGSTNDKSLKCQFKNKMAFKILKLSDKYSMPMIQNCCEEYLASQFYDKNFPKMELLEEAENLGLQKFKVKILESINSLDYGLRNNLQILARLKKQTQDAVIDQVEKYNNKTGCKRTTIGFGSSDAF